MNFMTIQIKLAVRFLWFNGLIKVFNGFCAYNDLLKVFTMKQHISKLPAVVFETEFLGV